LSAMLKVAFRAPTAAASCATRIVQLAPAARELPHPLARRKEVGLVPVNVMAVKLSALVPAFFTVTAWAAVVVPTRVDANVRVAGLSVTVGAAVPVPLIATVCGVPVAVSDTEIAAVSAAAAVGLKTAKIVQLAADARVAPQVFNW